MRRAFARPATAICFSAKEIPSALLRSTVRCQTPTRRFGGEELCSVPARDSLLPAPSGPDRRSTSLTCERSSPTATATLWWGSRTRRHQDISRRADAQGERGGRLDRHLSPEVCPFTDKQIALV